MAGRSDRVERGEQTRQRLLDVGLAMLRDEPADHLFDRLQAPAICARAGVTTGSFYHHFHGQDGFMGALLERALAESPNPPFAAAVAVFEDKLTAGASFVDALIAGCSAAMDRHQANPSLQLQMAVWAKSHRDPTLARRLDRMYRMVEDQTIGYYEAILVLLGREMRPPFTLRDVAQAFSALLEGLTMRRTVSPGAVPNDRFGALLVPVINVMTRAVGDDEDASDWLRLHGPSWAVPDPTPPKPTA